MTTPIELAIVRDMQAAMQGITRAAGYFNDVKASSVVTDPVVFAGMPITELPFLLVGHIVDTVLDKVPTSRPNAIQIRKRWTIEAAIDANGISKLQALIELEADLEKALTVDKFRGGLAMFTYVNEATRYFGLPEQSLCYLALPVEVLWQRAYEHP